MQGAGRQQQTEGSSPPLAALLII